MTLRLIVLAPSLVLMSCAPPEEALRPATPDCLLGVWRQVFLSEDGMSTVCPFCESDPLTASEECEQADCAEGFVWAITEEMSVWGRWRWSEELGSITMPRVCPLTQRTWRVDEPGVMVFLASDPARNEVQHVECTSSRLAIEAEPIEEYMRAPNGFAAAALRMIATDECSRSYDPP